jgi:hypothetical protein
VAEWDTSGVRAFVGRFLRGDAQRIAPLLIARLRRVLTLDREVFAEITADPAAIPQASAIVIGSSLVAGLGQGLPVLVFLGVAWALLAWLLAAGLIWGVATILLAREIDYPRLLVGLGYGYVWTALLLFARLPGYLGALVSLAAVGLCFAAFVQASEHALGVPTERALAICAAALVVPFVLLLAALI